MKKLFLIVCACFTMLLCAGNAFANNPVPQPNQDPMNWEISMMPKPTAEEIEAAHWSVVVENDLGVYAYDMGSLDFAKDKNDEYDRNVVNVLVKTVFTNKDVLKKLKQDYAEKLEGKEKVLYCKMDMQYKMKEKAYTVKTMQVFTNTDRQIDVKKNKNKFAPIPEKSFAEALYEVCQKFVADVAAAEQAAKEQAAKEAKEAK